MIFSYPVIGVCAALAISCDHVGVPTIIMAAGAFVQGSSIELSADGPIETPYAVYFQGGLTWYHARVGITMSLQYLVQENLVKLP